LNPRAWDLVNDLKSGWRDFARRHPTAALFPVNLPIFVAAGIFNFWYNKEYYLPYLRDFDSASKAIGHATATENAFWWSAGILNPTLYVLGIYLVVSWGMPITRALMRVNRGETLEPDVLLAARRRAIALGYGVAAVGISLWLVAGIAFPIFIRAVGGGFPPFGWIHFMLSMIACGIISCCLPFLASTWLSVRAYFPALLVSGPPEPTEQRRLLELGQHSSIALFTSPVAPLIGILLVMFSKAPANSNPNTAMTALIGVAIAGFGAAFATWQRILADLEALSVVSRPADMVGITSDTVETI
jgi:hypothetical protein